MNTELQPDPPADFTVFTSAPLLPPALRPYLSTQGLSLPDDFPFDDWAAIGPSLSAAYDKLPIVFGQWLRYGEDKYPDRYAQAILLTGLADQTLYNAAWVARSMEGRFRDTARLCYSAQAATASLPPPQSEAVMDWAEESGATVREIRDKVKQVKGTAAQLTESVASPGEQVTLFVSVESVYQVGLKLTFAERDEVMQKWLTERERAGF